MGISNLTSHKAVLETLEEFDQLGRDSFLKVHGFGKAREYFLLYNGKRYDSKAIAGVAHGIEHPQLGPLAASDFSGGEKTVRTVLHSLGFTVVKGEYRSREPEALVLVENEVTVGGMYDFWADDTGSRYHFPNQYRNRVVEGTPFVYYRGVRRSSGRRGIPEYFGSGFVGAVWPDPSQPDDTPARNRRWYCAIEGYSQFPSPVAAKKGQQTYEAISSPLGWRTAVRPISSASLEQILIAGRSVTPEAHRRLASVTGSQATVCDPFELLVEHPPSAPGTTNSRHRPHPSRDLKRIGDWAEEFVYRWLCETLKEEERESVDWVAQRGETPGWDIAYTMANSIKVVVEVKATTATRFSVVEITRKEWLAAGRFRENFVLALVTRAGSDEPRIALMTNPVELADHGRISIEPTSYRLISRSGSREAS